MGIFLFAWLCGKMTNWYAAKFWENNKGLGEFIQTNRFHIWCQSSTTLLPGRILGTVQRCTTNPLYMDKHAASAASTVNNLSCYPQIKVKMNRKTTGILLFCAFSWIFDFTLYSKNNCELSYTGYSKRLADVPHNQKEQTFKRIISHQFSDFHYCSYGRLSLRPFCFLLRHRCFLFFLLPLLPKATVLGPCAYRHSPFNLSIMLNQLEWW